jgi:regulator of nonsense transcripts 3
MEQIDVRFAGRYNWLYFRPGKTSTKQQRYSRAYIDLKTPDDVIEFAEFFGGHVFVNEKGTQFKTIVEYSPSQRVPKQWSKRDGRGGTIHKDPEYLEFLELISKPVENLPSAEIQLERREAERAGASREAPIVTPLMDFIRQKRAAQGGPRRLLSNGKPSRRASGASSAGSSSAASKRGSEKRRVSTTMYVLRDTVKNSGGKDKSPTILVSKRDDHHHNSELLDDGSGVSGTADFGKKKILLLKGKEKEIPHVIGGLSPHQNTSSSPHQNTSSSYKNSSYSSNNPRQNQRREPSGRMIKSILLNKDSRQHRSSIVHSDQHYQIQERDKRPPRPSVILNGEDNKVNLNNNNNNEFSNEKLDKRNTARNKDRPDRGVWTPLRRSEGSHASDESLSSSTSQTAPLDSTEVAHGETKSEMINARSGEFKHIGSGRGNHSSIDNGCLNNAGNQKHSGRRGINQNMKDGDSSSPISDGKPLRRGGSSGYGSHEKQVWVQKSSSGS